jgi:hypothetical protein
VRPPRLPASGWALAGILVAAAAVILWAGRGLAPIADQWPWILHLLDPDAETFLGPYNGHLIATTWAVYFGILETFGLPEFWTFRVVALLLHLGVAILVFVYARRRLGPWPALAPAAAIAFLGTGSDVFLSGLNLGFAGATAACLGALAMLDRDTRGADLAASALLVVGLASFTSAIAFTAGVFVEVLLRRDRWRRIWVPVVPTLLYVVWRQTWGEDTGLSAGSTGGILDVAQNALDVAAGAVAGLAGAQLLSPTLQDHFPWLDSLARLVVVLAVVALAWLLVRRRELSGRLANLLATGAILWVLLALGRGEDPFRSRYVYLGAVVVVLIVVELAGGVSITSRAIARAAAIAVAVSVALNVGWMIVWGNHLRRESNAARAELAALDIAREHVAADFHPSRAFRLKHVGARRYFRAVQEFGGSPAFSVPELRSASAVDREAADRVLVRALDLSLVRGTSPRGGAPPTIESVTAPRMDRTGSCIEIDTKGGGVGLDLEPRFPAGVVIETAPAARLRVRARRFGDVYEAELRGPDSGRAILATPLGLAGDPWHLRLVSRTLTTVCSRTPAALTRAIYGRIGRSGP